MKRTSLAFFGIAIYFQCLWAQSPMLKYFADEGYNYKPIVLRSRSNGDYFLAQSGTYYDTTGVIYLEFPPAGIYTHSLLNHNGDTIWAYQTPEPSYGRSQQTYVEDGQGLYTFFRNGADNFECDGVSTWLFGWFRTQYYQMNLNGDLGPQKALNMECEAIFHDALPLRDGGKILVCSRRNKTAYFDPEIFGQIAILNHNNDLIHERSYPNATFANAKLVERDDCSFLMAYTSNNRLYISTLTQSGQILSSNQYDLATPKKFIALKDGGFMLLAKDNAPFVCYITKDGSIAWRKYFAQPEAAVDMAQMPDRSLALLFNRADEKFGVAQIDYDGNVRYNRTYALPDPTATASFIAANQDGTYAIAGFLKSKFKVRPGQSFLLIDTLPLPVLPPVQTTTARLNVFEDANGNCQYDNGETLHPHWKINIANGIGAYDVAPNQAFPAAPTSYTVDLIPPPGEWSICPFEAKLTINADTTVYFGVKNRCQTVYTNIDTTVCQRSYYKINGVYCELGINVFKFSTISGCDSTVTIHLKALPKASRNINLAFCKGGSVVYQGVTYTASDSLTFHFSVPGYCDSVVTVKIVEKPDTTYRTYTSCRGEPIKVGNSVYVQPGVYTDVLTSYLGCDSVVVSRIQPKYVNKDTYHSLCPNPSVVAGNHVYTTFGNFKDTVQSTIGCDTIFTRHIYLSVKSTYLYATICKGTAYMLGNSAYSAPGTYKQHLLAANGCDSIVNLTLQLYEPIAFFNFKVHPGQVIKNGVLSFDKPGTYIDTLTSYKGCDSIVTTSIHLDNVTKYQNIALCKGQTYTVNGQAYTAPAIVCDTFASCYNLDSVVYVALTQGYYYAAQEKYICPGKSVTVGNSVYTTVGNYFDTIPYQNGCDLILKTKINWGNKESYISKKLCRGESVTVNNTQYSQPGSYAIVLKTWQGCDSTIRLSIYNQTTENKYYYVCPNTPLTIAGRTIKAPVDFSDTLTSFKGCDSIIRHIVYWNTRYFYPTFGICPGDKVKAGNSTYSTPGSYRDTLKSWQGCDSIIYSTVYWNSKSKNFQYQICPGEIIKVANRIYTQPGNYRDTLKTWRGCDSILYTFIQWRSIGKAINAQICPGGSVLIAGKQYSLPGIYRDTFMSFKGCDSIIHINVCYGPSIKTTDHKTICFGESFVWGGRTYQTTGIYTDTFPSYKGCDSIVRLDLKVLPTRAVTQQFKICHGESVVIGNTAISQSGTYIVRFQASNGCDSVVTTTIQVHPTQKDSVFLPVPHGSMFMGVRIFNDTLVLGKYKNHWGCDSIKFYFIDAVTSAQEGAASLFRCSVAPNPNNGQFWLETTFPTAKDLVVRIFNADGSSLLLRENVYVPMGQQRMPLQLPDAPNGIYWVVIEAPTGQLWKINMVVIRN